LKKYKVIKEIGGKESRIIESNIEECELESYIRKYLQLEHLVDWYERKYDTELEYNSLTIADLEDNINNYVHELCENMIEWDIQLYLGNSLFLKGYEQNVRLFISALDHGELVPVCARPDGEHKLIILDNGVVHSDTTDKPVGTITYSVGVDDYDFGSFRFCCEVVISTAKYLNSLGKDISLADMILEHFNGKTPFDIEFAEKEKQ
jgi:hypothetical protein